MSDIPRSLFKALYMDGDNIRPIEVDIVIEDTLKVIKTNDQGKVEEILAQWSYDAIRSHDSPSHVLIISNLMNENYERLEITNPSAIRLLKEKAANMGQAEKIEASNSRKVAALAIGALLSVAIIIVLAIPLLADLIAPIVPVSIEQRLGNSVKDQIAGAFGYDTLEEGTCKNAAGNQALAKMVDKIAANSDLPYELDVRVIKHDLPNAFALPGGHVVFMDSIIDQAKNPDEIFGVLAHEIGHVKHRDGLRLILQVTGRSFFISMIIGDFTGSTAIVFAIQTLLHLSYSREVEHQADLFAIEQLKHHRVATKPLGDLLERINRHMLQEMGMADGNEEAEKAHRDHEKKSASLLDSHPLTENRKILLSKPETNNNTLPSLSEQEWHDLKNICRDYDDKKSEKPVK